MTNKLFSKPIILFFLELKKYFILIVVITLTFLTSSCATIIGGSKYNAKVQVQGHPDAKIEYKNKHVGTGEASLKVERKEANNFSVVISKEGCEPEIKSFTERKFRGWAFTGSLLGFTGLVSNVPIPWGVGVDAITGAWWKPDISEIGVSKVDYNHYVYNVTFENCQNDYSSNSIVDSTNKSKAEILIELKKLFDEGIISEEEFEIEKEKILKRD